MELAFQLKGRLFTLSVLHIMSTDLAFIEQQLIQKVKQAPQFFNNTPMVIDLTGIDDIVAKINLDDLVLMLKKHTIYSVGFIGTSHTALDHIKHYNLPIIKEARATAQPKREINKIETQISQPRQTPSKTSKAPTIIIKKQVRSGQQIYAPDGDLIVLATVSSGAELLAEGNIHVYGALYGRALAGINGDINARIFCTSLQANIVSIAGQYKLLDDTSSFSQDKAQQVYLQNGQLIIEAV